MPEFPAFKSCCPPGLTTFFTQMLSLEDNKTKKTSVENENTRKFLHLAANRAQTKVLQSSFLLAKPETLILLLDTFL